MTPVRGMLAAVALVGTLVVVNAQSAPGSTSFRNVTTGAGIGFTHTNGARGDFWYPELFGGGVAVLDIDTDGWPDLLFVDGKDWAPGGRPARHALYQNDRDGTFTDVSRAWGLHRVNVYGLGASVADYDNDGRDDVFLTTIDGGRLLRNTGTAFTDVTTAAGIAHRAFAVSAAWLDYDNDGLPDLLVGNYVQWSAATEARCAQGGVRGYCGPDAYAPTAPTLYRNRGKTFQDVSRQVGLLDPTDKAMGLAVVDIDRDGWQDLFIGSDRVPAKLYRNDRGRHFTDVGLTSGVALSEMGAARANMGVDAADYDRSGWPSIAVGNFVGEMLGLYGNDGGKRFVDRAPRTVIGRASLPFVTWAVFFFDYDLDGWPDLFAVNGGTDESQGRDSRARVSQPPLLLRNMGQGGSFEDVSARVGADLARPIMGRGAAYADVDRDGDLDLVVTSLAGPAALFLNDGSPSRHWLRVRAVGATSTRSGLGAVVTVTSASGTQWSTVKSGSSYASQSELPLTFGLGADRVASLDVRWPSGTVQRFADVTVDRQVRVHETAGLSDDRAAASRARPAPLR